VGNLEALAAFPASITVDRTFAIESLSEGSCKASLADAIRTGKDKALTDSPLPNGAPQQGLHSIVAYYVGKWHSLVSAL